MTTLGADDRTVELSQRSDECSLRSALRVLARSMHLSHSDGLVRMPRPPDRGPGWPPGEGQPGGFGRFPEISSGAKRSPWSSIRPSTSLYVNDNGAEPFAVAATSSQLTGVDTVAVGRARSE